MESVLEVLPVVVSDIKSDGSFQKSLRDFIRDQIIEDGGSIEFALLRNQYMNIVVTSDFSRVVIVPTQSGMEKMFKKGAINISFLTTDTEELRTLFNLHDGYVKTLDSDLSDAKMINVENKPTHIRGNVVEFSSIRLKIVKTNRLKHNDETIIFIYISGMLMTTKIRKMITQ